MTTPRTMALAAIIHHDCSEHGWSRTSAEIAADLVARYPAPRSWEVTARHIARVARERGWTNRLRGKGTPIISGTLATDQRLAMIGSGRGSAA